jgi:spore cortex biosynthesis protein YabQ
MEGLESFFTVSQQLRLFGLSCLLGIPVGILFDIFRTFRIVFPHGKILVAIEDILFFFIYSVSLMSFTVVMARSEFRVYFCIGNFIGFVIYYFTVGNIVVNVIKTVINVVRRFLYMIFCPLGKIFVILCNKMQKKFVFKCLKLKITKKNSKTP